MVRELNYRVPVEPDELYDPIFKAIKKEGRDTVVPSDTAASTKPPRPLAGVSRTVNGMHIPAASFLMLSVPGIEG
jgi:hypothetical protein